jgi:hypothetical protein
MHSKRIISAPRTLSDKSKVAEKKLEAFAGTAECDQAAQGGRGCTCMAACAVFNYRGQQKNTNAEHVAAARHSYEIEFL